MSGRGELGERLRDDPDFVRYWWARTASIAGTVVTMVALPVLVYRLSGSPQLTALATMLEALPYLAFGLLAGAVGDRRNRRRVMVVADLVNALVLTTVPLAWWLGVLTVPHVLVVAVLVPSVATFFDGANAGALPVLVGAHRVGVANSAVYGAGGVLDLLMPAVTGLALAVVHPADLLVVDALSFAASAFLVRGIRRALSGERAGADGRAGVLAEVREGLRFLWRHPGVRSQTIVGTLQSMAGAGYMALLVPFADRVLGVGTSGWRFGALYAVWGVGGVLAAVVTPRLLRRMGTARLTLIAIPVSGASGVLAGAATTWWVAVVGVLVWGISYQVVLINSISYRQEVTPEHLQSRVNTAGRMLAWGLGWSVGAAGAAALLAQVGLRPAMVVMVSVGALAAAYAWLSPLPRLSAQAGAPAGRG